MPWPWSASLFHLFIKFIKIFTPRTRSPASVSRLPQTHWTALKSDSFLINFGWFIIARFRFIWMKCAHCISFSREQQLISRIVILLLVFVPEMEIGILSTIEFKERCDKAKNNNYYAMLHFQHLCSSFRIYLQLEPFIIMSLSTHNCNSEKRKRRRNRSRKKQQHVRFARATPVIMCKLKHFHSLGISLTAHDQRYLTIHLHREHTFCLPFEFLRFVCLFTQFHFFSVEGKKLISLEGMFFSFVRFLTRNNVSSKANNSNW